MQRLAHQVNTMDSGTSNKPTEGDKMFRLLELPRELRDNIYQVAVLDERTFRIKTKLPDSASDVTEPDHSRGLVTTSPIILASKQLHVEYLEAMSHAVLASDLPTKIEATVTDLDFGKVMNFLGRYSTTEIDRIANTRKLHIKLILPSADSPRVYVDALDWNLFCEKYGVTASYEFEEAKSSTRRELEVWFSWAWGVALNLLVGY